MRKIREVYKEEIMKQHIIQIVAVLIVVLMIFSIASPTISYAVNELLTEDELESQGTETNSKSVEFDVYGEDEKHSINADLSAETIINFSVKVKDAGYLENATVDFSDANFVIDKIDKDELVEEITDKQMKLNKINGGDTIEIKATIKADIKDRGDKDFFNKDNEIKFTATYVNEKQRQKKVNKELIVHTSWNVEEAKLNIEQELQKYILITSGNQKGILLQESISSSVANNILPIKTSHIEINVPKIENILPTKVNVIANSLEFQISLVAVSNKQFDD